MLTAETPDRIGRYEILSELGRGSMGRVFLARDPNIDRRLALKVLEPQPGVKREDEAELRQRFVLEARAAGRVSHPGIVTVYDAQTDPESGVSFIAMEWIDGVSLEHLLRDEGPLPLERAVRLVADVATALDAAHREGLVHRDIKPANLLLDRDGRIRISDFGIAKLASQSHTVAGRILGSPFYMSPEQVRSEPVDGRSDLFSLGVVLYQAVTGMVPFGGESLAGITYKILEIDPRPVRSIHPRVPASLAAVIDKALEKAPADRFRSGLDFAAALRAVERELDGEPAAGRTVILPAERPERRWGWMLAAGVGAAVLLGLLAVGRFRSAETDLAAPAEPAVAAAREAAAEPVAEPTAPPDPAVPSEPSRAAPVESSPGERSAPVAAAPAATAPASAASPVQAPRPARIEVSYANRLRSGVMTVHVDDRRVWSRSIGAGGFVERALGEEVRAAFEVAPGKHVVGVTIVGSEGTVEASKRIWGSFEAGRVRRLRVVLVPPTVLRLSWRD